MNVHHHLYLPVGEELIRNVQYQYFSQDNQLKEQGSRYGIGIRYR